MKFLPANQQVPVNIPIIMDGEYTQPTSDISVKVNLNGVITNSTISKGDFSNIVVNIPATDTPITQLGYATVSVSCLTPYGGFISNNRYALLNYDDLFATHDDVRTLLGVTEIEVENHEIDLEQIYLKMYPLFLGTFHTARQTDILLNNSFGRMLALTTAVYVAPRLLLRLAGQQQTENGQYKRWGSSANLADFITALQDQSNKAFIPLNAYLITPMAGFTGFFKVIQMPHESTGTTS